MTQEIGSFYKVSLKERLEGYFKNLNCFKFLKTLTLEEKISIEQSERKFSEEEESLRAHIK